MNNWYVIRVVTLVTICDKMVIGLLEGANLHNVIKGTDKQIIKKGPNVFNTIFKWVNGKVMVSVVMKPTSH